MRVFIVPCFLVLFTFCVLTEEQFYQEQLIPQKPDSGFVRNGIFPNYLNFSTNFNQIEFYRQIAIRKDWIAQNGNFKKQYPFFNVELLAVNQLPNNSFSWQERLIFADALDLVVFVVNHPSFLTEMQKEKFFDNEGQKVVSAEEVVQHIRNSFLYFYIGKDDLDPNVLAQATVGGFHHTIWFRNDTDYQNYDFVSLAVILMHELTHNLGYLHASNVPHGIQNPFLRIVVHASYDDMEQFISYTPYYEDIFLTQIRQQSLFIRSTGNNVIIQKDYVDDFKLTNMF